MIECQAGVRDIHVDPSLREYILAVVTATRDHPAVSLGASPRGSLSLMFASQALAGIHGREFVAPDEIKAMAIPVLAHRVLVRPEHRIKGLTSQSVIQEVLHKVPVPVGMATR